MVIKNKKVEAVEGFGVSGHVTWSIIVGWRDLVRTGQSGATASFSRVVY